MSKSPSIDSLGKIIAVWFLMMLLPCAYLATESSQSEKGHARRGATPHELRRELETTAKRFFALIEKGDPKELPLLCSRKGVVFGIDQPEISRATITRQIEQKEGVYCLLFDTECLRKEDQALWGKESRPARTQPLCSYRERFGKATSRDLNISVSRISGVWSGYVTVNLKEGPVREISQLQNPLEFEFVYEERKWKLLAIPYY